MTTSKIPAWNGPGCISSHDIYGRVFALLDQEALERGFSRWVQLLAFQLPGEVVAIDGKTARRFHDHWQGCPRCTWSASGPAENRCPVQRDHGHLPTPGTAGLHRDDRCHGLPDCDCRGSRRPRADYVLSLKQNQPHLHAAVVEMFAHERSDACDACPHTIHRDGWQGPRPHRGPPLLGERRPGLPALCRSRPGLVMVEAEHRLADRTTTGIRYFVSSLPARDARLLRAVRRHWRVSSG